MSPNELPDLSIVATMYRSEPFVEQFYRRISESARRITDNYEIVLVNDGSPDHSIQIAIAICETDSRVRVVDLSRNVGHHAAVLAGLRYATGQFVFLLDIDLEEQPEWLVDFWNDLHSDDSDVVYGIQSSRVGSLPKRWTGTLFYKLFNASSDTRIPENVCTVRLMTRRYVDALTLFTESHLFMAGLCVWTGFKQRARTVTKTIRPSRSSYSPIKLVRLFLNAVTSFSSYPLTIIFGLGMFVTFLAAVYGCKLIIQKLLHPALILSGFTSVMVSLWFLGGMIMSALGILGIYVGNIFVENKSRPQYLVRAVYSASATFRQGYRQQYEERES
jgi:putative glycosyltransferase